MIGVEFIFQSTYSSSLNGLSDSFYAKQLQWKQGHNTTSSTTWRLSKDLVVP